MGVILESSKEFYKVEFEHNNETVLNEISFSANVDIRFHQKSKTHNGSLLFMDAYSYSLFYNVISFIHNSHLKPKLFQNNGDLLVEKINDFWDLRHYSQKEVNPYALSKIKRELDFLVSTFDTEHFCQDTYGGTYLNDSVYSIENFEYENQNVIWPKNAIDDILCLVSYACASGEHGFASSFDEGFKYYISKYLD